MTQLILNIEDIEVLGVLKNLIKHLNGVSIAKLSDKSQDLIEPASVAAEIRAGYGEVLSHIEGKSELPLAKDLIF